MSMIPANSKQENLHLEKNAPHSNRLSRLERSPLLLDDVAPLEILFQNEDFLAVNKPHDIRMDGPHDISLQKLLIRQFGHDINSYKWIHQLDYATSGSILIARNRWAAAAASLAFSSRLTTKEYTALVYGHVTIDHKNWKIINQTDITALRYDEQNHIESFHRNLLELSHEKAHEKVSVAVDSEYLQQCIDALNDVPSKLSELSTPGGGGSSQVEEYGTYAGLTLSDYLQNYKLRKKLKKFLKKLDLLPMTPVVPIAPTPIPTVAPPQPNAPTPPPYKFQLDWPPSSKIYYYYPDPPNTSRDPTSPCSKPRILVLVPTSEVDNEFSCEFSHEGNIGRYAETEIEVLGYGNYYGQQVTRLRLLPRTGRRHQLRLHCLAIGHPIVGDMTYAAATHHSWDPSQAHRMMLHARKLRVPIEGCREGAKTTAKESFTIEVETSDPFEAFATLGSL